MHDFDALGRPLRVLHLVPHLEQGGAEATLANLVNSHMPGVEPLVCTLMPGPHHFTVDAPVFSGTVGRGQFSLASLLWVRSIIKQVQPDILHSWMYHCNFLSTLVKRPGTRLVWSVHHETPATIEKGSTRLISRACGWLSHRFPSRIAYVAHSAQEAHEAVGYDASKGVVVENGIDMYRFALRMPRTRARSERIRIGLIARLDPVKGHGFLIDAVAAHPLRDRFELHLVGSGCNSSPDLARQVKAAGLKSQTKLLGVQQRIEDIYAGLDVVAIPSFSEALPLVALEAAAMGLPVVASRVGDLANLGFPEAMTFEAGDQDGFIRALDVAIACLGDASFPVVQRRQVAERFSQQKMANGYRTIYNSVMQPH